MSDQAKPTPAPERNTPTTEVADELSVERRTVTRWADRGCPHKRTKSGLLFNVPEVMAWLKANGLTGEPGHQPENVSDALTAARLRKENALAARHELWLERETGRLIPRDDAVREMVRINTIVAQRIRQLPASAAPGLVGRSAEEIEIDLEGFINEIEKHLSESSVFDLSIRDDSGDSGMLEAGTEAKTVAVGG